MKNIILTTIILLILISLCFSQNIKVNDQFPAHYEMDITGLVSGIGFDVFYDTSKIEYISNFKYQVFNHENCTLQNNTPGILVTAFNMQASHPIKDTKTNILTLMFVAKDTGYTEIVFDNQQAVLGENPIESEWHDTNFIIQHLDKLIMKIRIGE